MYCYHCMSKNQEGTRVCVHCGKEMKSDEFPHHLKPGTILDKKYLVGNYIGEGGFGITYVGLDLTLDMKIAIKEFYPTGYANRNNTVSNKVTLNYQNEDEYFKTARESFLREAKNIAKFHGEKSIVDVRAFFEENETAYIIMEYLDGDNLSDKLKVNGNFEPEALFRLFIPVMQTLKKMHRENIIHRDISPENIRMVSDGTLKLMDFGSARYYAGLDKRTMSIQFKPGFAPFEQYNKDGNQGPWTDVYGLCATIYKCITGKTPVDSVTRSQTDTLKKPSELGVNIREQLETVLMYGLAVYPENRCKDMDELLRLTEEAFYNQKAVIGAADNATVYKTKEADERYKTVFADANHGSSINNQCNDSGKKHIITIVSIVVALFLVGGIVGFLVFNSMKQDNNKDIDALVTTNASETVTTTGNSMSEIPTEIGTDEKETTIEKGHIIDSGTSGECLWELDDNGLLYVKGNGSTADYSAYEPPWYSIRLQIKCIFLEEGVTGVGTYSFMDCENLLTVHFSKHLNKINDAAFYKCNSLKEIQIPQSAQYIGFNAFGACRNLTQIIVDEKNEYYTSVNGNLFTKDKSTLLLYAIGKTDSSYSVPDGTIKIGDDAFEKSPYLVRIRIPESVVSIGKWAFEYCSSLLYVEIPPSTIEIGDNAFEQCLDNLSIIGQSNSYAESFAVKNKMEFVVRDQGL